MTSVDEKTKDQIQQNTVDIVELKIIVKNVVEGLKEIRQVLQESRRSNSVSVKTIVMLFVSTMLTAFIGSVAALALSQFTLI